MYIGVSLILKNIEQGNCGTLTFNETLFMKRIN